MRINLEKPNNFQLRWQSFSNCNQLASILLKLAGNSFPFRFQFEISGSARRERNSKTQRVHYPPHFTIEAAAKARRALGGTPVSHSLA
jgi:hypothetical protein